MNRQNKNHYEFRQNIHHRALMGRAKNSGRQYIWQKSSRTTAGNGRYQRIALQKPSPAKVWQRCLNAVALGLVASVSGLLLLWFVQNLAVASADLQIFHYTLPYSIGDVPRLLQ